MRKRDLKLRLNRETLRLLDGRHLQQAAGASEYGVCMSDFGMCDPSAESLCGLLCPMRPPTIEP